VFAFSRDITQRKRTELALQDAKIFKQAILDAVSTQVAVLDKSGAIVEVNAAWHRAGPPREDGQPHRNADIGANYLEVCQGAHLQSRRPPLPPDFDLASGAGCGTGLDLVRTLNDVNAEQAFETLRGQARSRRMKIDEVAREVLGQKA
jgi:hypothetical protein